ncbi:MAG: hypothetical protein Q7R56_00400 [Nanoarchaeota archaeon]|nr:hypothetical protein [Nanoarchaeota archaeon]
MPKFKLNEKVWAISTDWIDTHKYTFEAIGQSAGTKLNYKPEETKIYEIDKPYKSYRTPNKLVQRYRLNNISWWNQEENIFHTKEECEAKAIELRKENIKELTESAKNSIKRCNDYIKHLQNLINNEYPNILKTINQQ